MAHDRSEQRDLSDQEPEVVERLAALWQAWADRAEVVAWDDLVAKRR